MNDLKLMMKSSIIEHHCSNTPLAALLDQMANIRGSTAGSEARKDDDDGSGLITERLFEIARIT
jgi:hypothetical protein